MKRIIFGIFMLILIIFIINNVFMSKIIIDGLQNHPEERKLKRIVYDAMKIKPGMLITSKDLKTDLNKIYATGYFSLVRINSQDSPLGVRIIVSVKPNPLFIRVEINQEKVLISESMINSIFKKYYNKTLNLYQLQTNIEEIEKWYSEQGYSLARIKGPDRISPDGIISLNISEGIINDIKVRWKNSDGDYLDTSNDEDQELIKIIKNMLETKKDSVFNRKILDEDVNKLYKTDLYKDIKISLGPIVSSPGSILIYFDIEKKIK